MNNYFVKSIFEIYLNINIIFYKYTYIYYIHNVLYIYFVVVGVVAMVVMIMTILTTSGIYNMVIWTTKSCSCSQLKMTCFGVV
jgi:hypothetical protein